MLQRGTIRTRAVCATLALAGATLAAATVPAVAAPAAAPRATACPTGWGSLPEADSTDSTATPVRNVRTGRHACYDRMVVDVPGASGGDLGYSVRYVDRLVQDGSGRHIPVAGGAVLEVRVAAPAYAPETGEPTYPARAGSALPGVNLTGYRTFRDARYAGSFEGETQIGLGVRSRLPFRVLRLDGHLVIDVAHNWTGSR
ncbi:AMIN-like domain-containing (lipo)protein [Streptomyces fungicidicus]|uniref:AMIN-like domain-containing (lipo)protein n=1 Tax=Streptomyces fungicidicus TaxID=68203 RepID=UPI003817BBC5